MHRFFSIFFFLLFLLAALICVSPYIPFREGSFFGVVFSALNSLGSRNAGFFPSGPFADFTLFPVALFLLLLFVDVVFRLSFRLFLATFLFFTGFYFVSFSLFGPEGYRLFELIPAEYHVYSLYAGIFLLFLCLLFPVFSFIGFLKTRKENKRKKAETVQDSGFDNSESEQGVQMKPEEAKESLLSVEIPEFRNYGNFEYNTAEIMGNSISRGIFSTAFDDGNMRRTVLGERQEQNNRNRERLDEVFRPRNLKRRLEEEARAGMNFNSSAVPPSYPEQSFDVHGPQTSNQTSNVVYVQQPVPQPQVIYVQQPPQQPPQVIVVQQDSGAARISRKKESEPEAIIDEGTDGSEDVVNALAYYREMQNKKAEEENNPSEKGDFVSPVGGLVRSSIGGYLYNAAKFSWKFPPETFLKRYNINVFSNGDVDDSEEGQRIMETFRDFHIETNLIHIQRGPAFTLYELTLAKGIRLNSVLNLADNIALELAVDHVRILAPIPGKSAIGVEIPNRTRETIGFESMMPALKKRKLRIPMVLGKTITGDSIIVDVAGAPHLIIAGTTGSGKSVCVNALICSILYTKTPKEVRMIMIDPKMVELSIYNGIAHLLTPVITDPKKAIKVMSFCIDEMTRRMKMFTKMKVRTIDEYNAKISEGKLALEALPYILVIVDEYADLMMIAGKELELYIQRITQMARNTGIHLVLATQRPSAEVITGIIKSNMPSRIAFAVSSQVNSRIIIDELGAENLLGRGDMLYKSASNPVPQRIQGAFIETEEIEQITDFVKAQGEPDYIDESYFEDESDSAGSGENEDAEQGDTDLFMKAWQIVYERGEASASYLQRRLFIGYNKAANIIEQMEEQGIVGAARGSKPREVLKAPRTGESE